MKNQLRDYKFKTFSTWPELAELTGLDERQLMRVAKMDNKQILTLRLSIYHAIKEALDIDLLEVIYE